MEWLKDHVYIAAWLALPITVIVAFIQNKRIQIKAEGFPLKKSLAYLLFLICFPMSLTPAIDGGTRALLALLSIGLLITILAVPESAWHK